MGNDYVIFGNGDLVTITRVGYIFLHTPQGTLPLEDVLFVMLSLNHSCLTPS